MPTLKPGDKAPAFTLADQNENKVRLSDFRESKLLLYFYPQAGTSGWTVQAEGVRDALEELKKLKVAAVGISPDLPPKLKQFNEQHGLGFPLLSDPDRQTAQAYGAWGEKTMYGKKTWGIVRSSFLLDEKGKIAGAWYKVSPQDTVPKALEALKGKLLMAKPGPLDILPEVKGDREPVMRERLGALFGYQRLAVLSSHRDGQPYSNLVAFAATPDLRGLVFATTRATRKFENLTVDPRVSMLIDNRSNQISDFQEAMAVTAVGRVKELSGKQKSRILDLYLGKHPNLKEFVESPTCALLQVEVQTYILVERFQKVLEWQLKP